MKTTLDELIKKHEHRAAALERDLHIENTFLSELRSVESPPPHTSITREQEPLPLDKEEKEYSVKTNQSKIPVPKKKKPRDSGEIDIVFDFIRKASGPLSISDIVEGTKLSRESVSHNHVYRLKQRGFIISPERGLWEASDKEVPDNSAGHQLKPIKKPKDIEEEEEVVPIESYKASEKGDGEMDMNDFKGEMW